MRSHGWWSGERETENERKGFLDGGREEGRREG